MSGPRGHVPVIHVIDYLRAHLGKRYPYVFATAGPDSFDCSGLVLAAWKPYVALPHNTVQQKATCKDLAANGLHLEPGDLVFYYPDVHHVGCFIGWRWDGTPMVIQATDEAHGIENIPMRLYAEPVGYGRPPYPGWDH